jgi:hypothetical protein
MNIILIRRNASLAILIATLIATNSVAVRAGSDPATIKKIIDEGRSHSELMKNFEYLTDTIGPRLTASKRFNRAAEWTAQRMRDYGLQNVHLESWPFGRGWQRGIAYGRMTAPYEMQLDFRAYAWTPGTKGKVAGRIVTLDDFVENFDKYKGKLAGAFILAGEPARVEPDFNPRPARMSDKEFKEDETSVPITLMRIADPEAVKHVMARSRLQSKAIGLARQEGAAAIITDSGRGQGLLNASAYGPGRDPNKPQAVPMVVMAHEHYGTLYRLAHTGAEVRLEIEVTNYFEDGDGNASNVVGEIPGGDKSDESVILGAHLDSWDLGTGATDNGAGSMAVLEAARMLSRVYAASGIKPRRTIRFILFGGEEQGLLGSIAYVKAHDQEMARISGVFVLDTGTGRVRGSGSEGNKPVIPILTEILAPLRDMGVLYVNERTQVGTDHLSFKSKGVPAFAFFQDAVEYINKTHHSQTDTLDKILPDDLEQASIVMAVAAYSVADLDQMLPRKEQTHNGQ